MNKTLNKESEYDTVVVTGFSAITPLGESADEFWANLCNGVPSSPVSSEKLNTGSQSVIEESKQISEKIGYQTNDKKNS